MNKRLQKYLVVVSEHLGCIRAENDTLVMIQMRFADEVRAMEEIKTPKKVNLTKSEMTLAQQLIDQLTRRFDPTEYKDTYQEELERIIEEEAEGKKRKAAAAPRKAEVKDLMAAHRKSLSEGKKTKLYLVQDNAKNLPASAYKPALAKKHLRLNRLAKSLRRKVRQAPS